MVGVVNRQHGNPGAAGFFQQQPASSGQGRLGETVAGIDPDITRGHIFDHRHRTPIDPSAGQGRNIAGHPKHPVAVSAVALGAGAVSGEDRSHFGRSAMALENAAQQHNQIAEGNVRQGRACR